jgi:hypothetical protein
LKEGRFDLVRPRVAGVSLISVLATVFSGSSFASADEMVVVPSPPVIYVVLLPLVGATVLLLVALPPLLGRPYWRETPAFHVANTVTVTSLVTFLMAFVVFYVLRGTSGDERYTLAAFAAVITFLLTGVLVRYLLAPLHWAALTAGTLACVTVAIAYLATDATNADLWRTVEGLSHLLPLVLLIWLGVLVWETARFHYVERATHEEPETPRLTRRRRMLRLGELLIANMAVAAGIFLMVLS